MAARSEPFRPAGLYAAAVTPFRDDFGLDLPRLEAHLAFLLDAGVDGVAVIAGSGEFVSLEEGERAEVVATAVRVAGGRVPVVAGVLAPGTREAVSAGIAAARAGADALLVLPPYYIRPSFDGIVGHFRAVAGETGLPLIVYNNPGRTGVALGLRELSALAEVPAVVGVKDCDRDVASVARKVATHGDRLAILSGDDDLGFATLLSGAHGAIWATPNLAPRLCRALVDACAAADVERARPLHRRLLALVEVWDRPNHPGPLKELMAMAGRSAGPARPPLAAMSVDERERAVATLAAAAPIE